MKKVTKIDKVQNVTSKKQKLRVAAYCRVSTNNDAQLESLETQKAHYESFITSRDDWQFAGLYFDEGITGTSTKKRDGFNRMIEDALAGKIDLIPPGCGKSSRFFHFRCPAFRPGSVPPDVFLRTSIT